MLDRISALMEELRLLTDSLAHDLRSPASRLRAAAHAAAETDDPAEQEELLGSVVRNADALIRILSTMLEISRSEALTGRTSSPGSTSASSRPSWPKCTIRSPRSAARRCESTPSRPVPLFGHRQLLAQALSNLIENAIRYGSAGGEIDVRGRPAKSRSGSRSPTAGPASRRPSRQALRRFGRLDSSRSDEGAGLGLALAQSIAHLHEGELLLEDNRAGAAHHARLPVHKRPAALNAPAAAFSSSRAAPARIRTARPFV